MTGHGVDARRTGALLDAIVDRIAGIGLDERGATTRLAYSAAEDEAHRALRELFDERFVVSSDAAGNLWVVLPGSEAGLPFVLTGSHLDSVPAGGRWDGALGVYSAAAALLQLADSPTRLLRSIALVAFRSEESPRFAQAAYRFGSRAIAGRIDPGAVDVLADDRGVTLAAAMAGLGIDPHRVADARVPFDDIHAILELHIDQGLTVVRAGVPVAAVSAITGSTRRRVLVRGRADHSGAARMDARRDALAAAAELVLAAERIGRADADTLVLTVGVIRVEPGSVSVVPGLAEITLDVRSVDGDAVAAALAAFDAACRRVEAGRGVQVSTETIRQVRPVRMDGGVVDVVRAAMADLGHRPMVVPSHAGHDTGSFDGHPRLGMIFVRNVSGRSHTAEEEIEWGDAVVGAEALRESLRRLADEPADDPANTDTDRSEKVR